MTAHQFSTHATQATASSRAATRLENSPSAWHAVTAVASSSASTRPSPLESACTAAAARREHVRGRTWSALHALPAQGGSLGCMRMRRGMRAGPARLAAPPCTSPASGHSGSPVRTAQPLPLASGPTQWLPAAPKTRRPSGGHPHPDRPAAAGAATPAAPWPQCWQPARSLGCGRRCGRHRQGQPAAATRPAAPPRCCCAAARGGSAARGRPAGGAGPPRLPAPADPAPLALRCGAAPRRR